jgi:hypothetical protein
LDFISHLMCGIAACTKENDSPIITAAATNM